MWYSYDMDTKICTKCGEGKPLTEFALSSRNKDGRQYHCKECGRQAGIENYNQNKDRYYGVAKKRDRELREKIRKLKSVPCADCKQTFDPVCMDFDHLPEFKKSFGIAHMIRRRMAWSKIETEIAKCEVVCANCHRLRTRDRLEVIDE